MSPRSAADMLEIYSIFTMVLKTEYGFTLAYDCFNYVKHKKKKIRLVNNLLLNIIAIRSSERH